MLQIKGDNGCTCMIWDISKTIKRNLINVCRLDNILYQC